MMELEVAGLGEEEIKPIVSVAGGSVKAAAVARMYKGGDDGTWHYTGAWGAMALVYDKAEMAYHLRLIDLKTKQLAWTQELYYEFHYDSSNACFHFFEANETVIGLAFAHEGDAQKLAKAVLTHSPSREKLASMVSQFRAAGGMAEAPPPKAVTPPPVLKKETKRKSGLLSRLIKKKEPANKPISVISGPTNVKHEVHLGWDPRDGFQIRNIPPEWKKLFAAAGVKKSDLKDKDTAMFLIETVAARRQNQTLRRSGAKSGGPGPAAPESPAPPPPPPPAPAAPAPIQGGLAAAMQARLKKSEKPSDTQHAKNLNIPDLAGMDEQDGADLAAILATAMQSRRGVLRQDSDEENVVDEDEGWSTEEDADF